MSPADLVQQIAAEHGHAITERRAAFVAFMVSLSPESVTEDLLLGFIRA